MNLSKRVKVTQAITPTAGAAGTTDINGTILDMAGWEGVLMEVTFGAITASAVTNVHAEQDSSSSMTSAADLAGTGQTVADTDDGDIFLIDLYRPLERYVRVVVDRGTANAVVAGATYIQYGGANAKLPPSNGSTVNAEQHSSPAEGTA